jgi:hypothetical protein
MSITDALRATVTVSVAVVALVLPSIARGQQRRNDPGWPCKGTVDPVYVRTAEATGGVVMLFKPGEAAGAAAEMTASSRHKDLVFRAGGQLAEGEYEFEVPVDSTIESAYFFISMQCLQAVSLIRPSGTALRTDEAGVEYHQFEAIRMFTLAAPVPGPWKVRVAGRGFFSLVVKADTDVRLADVTFSASGFPVKRQPQQLGVQIAGAVSDVAFHFISSSAATIEPLALELAQEHDDYRTYAGEVTPPGRDFRVAMRGTDEKGFRVQRVHNILHVQ